MWLEPNESRDVRLAGRRAAVAVCRVVVLLGPGGDLVFTTECISKHASSVKATLLGYTDCLSEKWAVSMSLSTW